MFIIALIGPDGAGKTTIARELERALPRPAKYLYMGVNWDASDHVLPTTRLVRAIRRARGRTGANGAAAIGHGQRRARARPLRPARRALALVNRLAEECYRVALAWAYVRRGRIVVFDRDFFSDYHAHDIAGGKDRTLGRRIHGFFLARIYPRPRLVVYLDAPAEVLLARKGEGTLESLERRRQDYLVLVSEHERFTRIDANRPLPEVVSDVAAVIESLATASVATATEAADSGS